MMDEQERLQKANLLLQIIGDNGRHFFFSKEKKRYAYLEIDNRGRVWFLDDYTGKRIYTHDNRGRWKGFSHGGTLRCLVAGLRDFIKKGTPLKNWTFGPWPKDYCDGDLWGYGDDMENVRQFARKAGVTKNDA